MNENNMILDNKSLFVDIDQAIPELMERIQQYERRDLLMVVLSQDAMPVASQIARLLELNLTFSLVDHDVKPMCSFDKLEAINFDFSMVKESGRDMPQDYIFHQERNLRGRLMSFYEKTYKDISLKYPGEVIILVDELINDGSDFCPSLIQDFAGQFDEGASKGKRRFVYLHLSNDNMKGVDIIIENSPAELEQLMN